MNPELHRKLKEYDDKITKKTGKPPFWTRMQSWSLGLFFAFVIGIFIYPDIRIIMIILSMACLAANYYSFLKKTGEAAKFFTTEELINLSEHPENLQRFDKKTIEDFVKASHSFNQSLRLIRVILHCELKAELKQTVDAEYVGVLAGQIVNFLTGEVLNDCYQKACDGNKQKIDHIRDQILPCVHYKMKKDHKTRELIVYTLRMLIVFDFAAKKDTYLKSEQHKSRMDILSTYGAEFPIEASPVLYETIVMKYCKERYKFVEQPREDQ